MSEGSATLRYAVRLPVVAKYLGQLGLVLALLVLAPLATSLWYAEWSITWRLLIILGVLLATALPASRLPTPQRLQVNEALVIVCGAFLLGPLLMTLSFTAAGLSFFDALFEAISAITTTGLSMVAVPESMPRTFLFSRAWMQWYGGLGIVVLSVALLTGHHTTSRRLVDPQKSEGIVSTTRLHARQTFTIYLLLTVAGIAITMPLLHDSFTALTHVLSAVSTGGFSTFSQSLAALPEWSQRLAIMGVAATGAIPLALFHRAIHGNWLDVVRDSELWLLLVMFALVTLLLYLLASAEDNQPLLNSLFLALSAQSTSGFAAGEINQLTPAAKLVVILAMFIGGGVGSTAGGIKLLRLILLFKLLQHYLRRSASPPHAVIQPRLGERPLEDEELLRALSLVLLYIVVLVLSWLAFLFYDYAPLDALFEVTSALGTVGLSTGITSPEMPLLLKGVVVIDMLLGRLEIVALLVLCYPPTWFGKRTEST